MTMNKGETAQMAIERLEAENAKLRAEADMIGRKYTILLGQKLQGEDDLKQSNLQIEELKKQKDACVPLDVTLYGYKKVTVTPKPTDEHDIQGLKCLRVVLTPQAPSCEVKLAGGREVHIDGWANKVQLDLDTPFCPHDARTKKVAEELEKSHRLYSEMMEAAGDMIYPKRTDTAEPFLRLKNMVDEHRKKTERGRQERGESVKMGKCEGCGKPTSAVLCQPCFLSGDYQ